MKRLLYIKFGLIFCFLLLLSCKKEEEISPNEKFIGFYDIFGSCNRNIQLGPTVVAVKKVANETVSITVTDQTYQETFTSSDGVAIIRNTYKNFNYPECSIIIDSTNKSFYVGKIIDKKANRILGSIQNWNVCVNDFSDIIIVFDFNDGNKSLVKSFMKRR